MGSVLRVTENSFTATGIIGRTNINIRRKNSLSVVIEGAGVTNAVIVRGRLDRASAYEDIGLAIVGDTTAVAIFDIRQYDSIQFECTVFDAAGTVNIYASVFTDIIV